MSAVILLTLPLLWAQVNPASPGPATSPPQAATTKGAADMQGLGPILNPDPAATQGPAAGQAPAAATAPVNPMGTPNAVVHTPVAPAVSKEWLAALLWVYVCSDPVFTDPSLLGGFLTWLKAIGLLCLVGWVLSWLVTGIKERVVGQGRWYDYLIIGALVLTPLTVMLRVLESVGKFPTLQVGPLTLTAVVALVCLLLYVVWTETAIWRTIRKLGKPVDLTVLLGADLALLLGLGVGVYFQQQGFLDYIMGLSPKTLSWREGLFYGMRISVTYMGYVVGLRVLGLFLYELVAVRSRRLYSIARLSVYEANRRMWAPWVVITVFLLVLAFTHWFIQPPRAAEMGRLYVTTLTLLCSLLLTAMVTILTPLSIPTDIQQQTIYTVVSKPVRRLEMIWGRMIGYMALVTILVALFGGISLAYLWRTVGLTVQKTYDDALRAKKDGRMSDYKLLVEQADQLTTRMSARVPIHGSLSFLDSRGLPHAMGIDVGQDQSTREPRSHIEGATPSAAIWSFGIVPDPFTPRGQRPRRSTGGSRSRISSGPTPSNGIWTGSTSSTIRSAPPRPPRRSPTCPPARAPSSRRPSRGTRRSCSESRPTTTPRCGIPPSSRIGRPRPKPAAGPTMQRICAPRSPSSIRRRSPWR